MSEADEIRRNERRKRIAKERRQAELMTQSISKASTARAHSRPPPLVRKSAARTSALEMLASFLDTSVNILHEQLHAVKLDKDGKPLKYENGEAIPDHGQRQSAARLVIEKVSGAEGTYLPAGLGVVVDADDVVATGGQVVELVLNGELSIDAGVKIFALLEKQAGLAGLAELAELRELVGSLTGANATIINGVPGADQNPVWMRLKASNVPLKG